LPTPTKNFLLLARANQKREMHFLTAREQPSLVKSAFDARAVNKDMVRCLMPGMHLDFVL
jgi:hypothetical protein